MGEYVWPNGGLGAGVATMLLNRIDSVAALVDEGKYAKAREALSGRRWLEDVDLSTIPTAPLKRAQQWIDAAHDAVGYRDVDVPLVQRLLLEARRALASQ